MTTEQGEQAREAGLIEPEGSAAGDGGRLAQALRLAVMRGGWTELMPVQARRSYLLAGRDLMVQSRTGSGKTGAFILPILERIDAGQAACQALVLAPTRELARQVGEEAKILSGGTGVRTAVVYGGVAYGPQIQAFKEGAHLVVGTPGRILDHLLKRNLSLEKLRILVFDEADRMLSMGFYPDMKAIRRYLPSRQVQGCMFSATFPAHVKRRPTSFCTRAFELEPRPRARDRCGACVLCRRGWTRTAAGADHRGGEPTIGADLLQHAGAGGLCDGGAAAVWL